MGDNYIYVDSGMVLGETANPLNDATYVLINYTASGFGASVLKNKSETIHTIYKNQRFDTDKWTIDGHSAYGNQRAFQILSTGNFDPNAAYAVDYQILKTMHTTPGSITMQYQQDVLSAVSDLAEGLNGRQKADGALDMITDLSVYEKIIFNGSVPVGWMIDSSTMFLGIQIPYQPKKCTPILKINRIEVVKGTSSTGWNITNSLVLNSSVLGGGILVVYYKISDASNIADIKSYGAYAKNIDVELDCRGRL